jgi:hypothetical protein
VNSECPIPVTPADLSCLASGNSLFSAAGSMLHLTPPTTPAALATLPLSSRRARPSAKHGVTLAAGAQHHAPRSIPVGESSLEGPLWGMVAAERALAGRGQMPNLRRVAHSRHPTLGRSQRLAIASEGAVFWHKLKAPQFAPFPARHTSHPDRPPKGAQKPNAAALLRDLVCSGPAAPQHECCRRSARLLHSVRARAPPLRYCV